MHTCKFRLISASLTLPFLLTLFLLSSCKKSLDRQAPMQDAAYFRFFNGINYYYLLNSENASLQADNFSILYTPPIAYNIDVMGSAKARQFYDNSLPVGFTPAGTNIMPPPLVALFIDPVLDAAGLPVKAAYSADFLGTQQIYYTAQPNALGDPTQYIQGDFPGFQNIERAPIVNGVDLSRYARIPSGSHRIMIVYRPLYTTDVKAVADPGQMLKNRHSYYDLSQAQKNQALIGTNLKSTVVLDTTISFSAGQVYNSKLVDDHSFNLSKVGNVYSSAATVPGKYKLLVHPENFQDDKGQPLQKNKLYVRFLNHTNDPALLPDQFDVYHRISWMTSTNSMYNPTANRYMTFPVKSDGTPGTFITPKYYSFTDLVYVCTVSGRFLNNATSFTEIPNIPIDSLVYPDGVSMINELLNPGEFDFLTMTAGGVSTAAYLRMGSRHEFYFYPKGVAPSASFASGSTTVSNAPATEPFIGMIKNLDLQPVITNVGNNQTELLANTFELNTKYQTWNTFAFITNNTSMGDANFNYRVRLIQDKVR